MTSVTIHNALRLIIEVEAEHGANLSQKWNGLHLELLQNIKSFSGAFKSARLLERENARLKEGGDYQVGSMLSAIEQLREENAALKEAANTDQRTQLLQGEVFIKRFTASLSPKSLDGLSALWLMDLQDFKKLNDTKGKLGAATLWRSLWAIRRGRICRLHDQPTGATRLGQAAHSEIHGKFQPCQLGGRTAKRSKRSRHQHRGSFVDVGSTHSEPIPKPGDAG